MDHIITSAKQLRSFPSRGIELRLSLGEAGQMSPCVSVTKKELIRMFELYRDEYQFDFLVTDSGYMFFWSTKGVQDDM